MLPRPIIGLCGLKGCGKSKAAEYLAEGHSFKRVRFAKYLKDMLRAMGLTERELEGDLKELPCKRLGGKTPRWAMQSLGTEWGRGLISDSLWVDLWRADVDELPEGVPVVAEDVRFLNESIALRSVAPTNLLIKIHRPSIVQGTDTHVSEMMPFTPDVTLTNDGSLEDLFAKIDTFLKPAEHAFA